MDIDPRTYPSRTFVRFTAHNQLRADAIGRPIRTTIQRFGGGTYVQQAVPGGDLPSSSANGHGELGMEAAIGSIRQENAQSDNLVADCPTTGVDDTLFEEIVKTTLNANRYPELYQSCGTQEAAAEVEAKVVTEIVATYRKISQKQKNLLVQRLNKLL